MKKGNNAEVANLRQKAEELLENQSSKINSFHSGIIRVQIKKPYELNWITLNAFKNIDYLYR
jgi:hypothetical protein